MLCYCTFSVMCDNDGLTQSHKVVLLTRSI